MADLQFTPEAEADLFVVTDHKDFQMFQVGFPRLRFGSGNPDEGEANNFRAAYNPCAAKKLYVKSYVLIQWEGRSPSEAVSGRKPWLRYELRVNKVA